MAFKDERTSKREAESERGKKGQINYTVPRSQIERVAFREFIFTATDLMIVKFSLFMSTWEIFHFESPRSCGSLLTASSVQRRSNLSLFFWLLSKEILKNWIWIRENFEKIYFGKFCMFKILSEKFYFVRKSNPLRGMSALSRPNTCVFFTTRGTTRGLDCCGEFNEFNVRSMS